MIVSEGVDEAGGSSRLEGSMTQIGGSFGGESIPKKKINGKRRREQ